MKFNKKWLWLIVPILIFSLICLNSSSVSTVLLAIQGAITDGNLVKFSGTNGIGVDAGLSATNVVKCKFDATSAPTVNNDVDEGYTVGSRWLDITNDKEYTCLDNTDGAAVWIETTQTGAGSTTFTGLTDTPSSYSGQAGKYTKVNAGETALEFDTPAGAGTVTTSGSPIINDIARFTGATIIEGRSYAEFKADLDLEVGIDLQAYDATLLSIAALGTAADKIAYTTALDTWAETVLTSFGRSILDDIDASAVRTTLGLVFGVDVQAYDAALTSISGLTYVSPSFIKLIDNDTYIVRTLAEVKADLSLDNVENLKVKLDGTVAPGVSNDNTQGYVVGSRWIDITNDKEYVCLDASTGAAVWTETTGAGGGASQLSDLSDVGVTTPTDKYALMADGDSWESRALVEADISDLGTYLTDITDESVGDLSDVDLTDIANLKILQYNSTSGNWECETLGGGGDALTANPLSQFAATTSAELAGVISDEIGAGKLRFDTSVTAKTTTVTLTVAEAGTILVSASSDYTITLPTAVGNTGLTYHFKKTDANYNLITLDGDGAETFNYENSTSAPVQTYARLNTYGAEVTVVSDGANWQVYDEKLGQAPYGYAEMSATQNDFTNNAWLMVDFDTAGIDIGSNFDFTTWVSGSATSTSAGHLVDSGGAFTSDMVGKRVKNTTDTTYTYITAYNSATDLTVRDDIFVSGEGYEIKQSKWVVPVSGKYFITPSLFWTATVADVAYFIGVYKNNSALLKNVFHSSSTSTVSVKIANRVSLAKDDYISIHGVHVAGVDTVDISYDPTYTHWYIWLDEKD